MRRRAGLEAAATLLVAGLLDACFGEPPTSVHPVAAIGRLVAACERRAPEKPAAQLAYGGAIALVLPAGVALTALALDRALERMPLPVRLPLRALALKPAFALRALLAAGEAVERDLRAGDLDAGRRDVRALVSRDAASLDAGLVAAAAIESLAENLTDSVVAPLLAAAAFGLPGAYAYRAINTLDSMIGYRGRYEWLGKAAARLDDAVNVLPARLAAALLLAAPPATGGSARRALRTLRRDRSKTASPNAGWTMAAIAGALDVQLEKPDHYLLNRGGRTPTPADIAAARGAVGLAAVFACALSAAVAATVRRGKAA